MRKFIFLLFIFSTMSYGKVDILRVINVQNSDGTTDIVLEEGFYETSFNYESEEEANRAEFCFTGVQEVVNEVCSFIYNYEYDMGGRYMSGAHDLMKVESCEVNGEIIKAKYTLTDDYGSSFKVSRKIEACK